MDDEINVQWAQEFGILHLKCGPDSFARLAKIFFEQVPEVSEIELADVKSIDMVLLPEPEHQIKKSWRDQIAMLGCGIVGVFLSIIFLAGLVEVFSWFGF